MLDMMFRIDKEFGLSIDRESAQRYIDSRQPPDLSVEELVLMIDGLVGKCVKCKYSLRG